MNYKSFVIDYLNRKPRTEKSVMTFIRKNAPGLLPRYSGNFAYLKPDIPSHVGINSLINKEMLFFDNDHYYSNTFNNFKNEFDALLQKDIFPSITVNKALSLRPPIFHDGKIRYFPDQNSGEWLKIFLYSSVAKMSEDDSIKRLHCCPKCKKYFEGRPNQRFCSSFHRQDYNYKILMKNGYFREYMRMKRLEDPDYKNYYADYRS